MGGGTIGGTVTIKTLEFKVTFLLGKSVVIKQYNSEHYDLVQNQIHLQKKSNMVRFQEKRIMLLRPMRQYPLHASGIGKVTEE